MISQFLHRLVIGLEALALCLFFSARVVASEPVVFKIATIAPEGSSWMNEMRSGAAEIKERSGSRILFKFYGGGVMGNDAKVQRKMRIGQLQGGAFTAGALAEYSPDVQVYGLPLLFRNYEEVDYVREHVDAVLAASLDKAGLVTFGFSEGGFALLMANTPIRNLEDMRSLRVWVPEGDQISYAAMRKFGLAPVTLPLTDVMTGLQTGLLDVIAASPVGALALQWHTKVKYVNEMPVSYILATLAVDKKAFKQLSVKDQALVREVMERVYAKFNRDNRLSNQQAAQAMVANKIEFLKPAAGEFARWTPAADELYTEAVNANLLSAEILQTVQKYLQAFRAQHSDLIYRGGDAGTVP